MRQIRLSIVMILTLAAYTVAAEPVPLQLEHDGAERSYYVYTPSSYARNKPMPLLMVLHGRTSNGLRMADLTNFNLRAEQHGFMVVYPNGLDNQWNYLQASLSAEQQPDDADFLVKLTDELQAKYNIDIKRIYITGISNGGFMAQRMACYAPDRYAAFASVAAGGYASMALECDNDLPISMLYMHGTADDKVPWRGLGIQDADGNRQLVTMSITNSVKFWSNRNRCGPNVDSKEILPAGNSPGTHVKIFTANDCLGGSQVVLYAIIGGGHNWPGVPGFIPAAVAGRVNLDIHASDVIWEFFSGKALR